LMTRLRLSRPARPTPRLEILEDRLAPAGLVAVGAGEGRTPVIRFFDALTGEQRAHLVAYPASFKGGVRVATGDVNGDSVPDIITAPGAGITTTIKVFDGRELHLLAKFQPFGPGYKGGANVAVGDIDAGGLNEIVAATATGRGLVRTFHLLDGAP